MSTCTICYQFIERREYKEHYKACIGITKQKRNKPLRQASLSESFKKPVMESDTSMTGSITRGSYPICGVTVKFPYKPYPQQIIYMQRVIKALQNADHALLESPTGTGKTLSLLCAALAWQEQTKLQIEQDMNSPCPVHDVEEEHQEENLPVQTPIKQKPKGGFGEITSVCVHNPTTKKKKKLADKEKRKVHIFIEDDNRAVKIKKIDVDGCQVEKCLKLIEVVEGRSIFVEIPPDGVTMIRKHLYKKPECTHETWVLEPPVLETNGGGMTGVKEDEEDDDFTTPMKRKETNVANTSGVGECKEVSAKSPGFSKTSKSFTSPVLSKDKIPETCICSEKRKKFPKIYFGTRTHKQVQQVIRELRKTEYSQVKMSILSSREHSCVNPKLQKEGVNKNEKCQELRKERMCQYGLNSKLMSSHQSLLRKGITTAWDIEDLNKLGREITACSYYAAVDLAGVADIIFCPYNYLIDPLIVNERKLDLEGHIVIFDEGHNIEDQCRSGASYSVNQIELGAAIANIEETLKRDEECWKYNKPDPERGLVSMAQQMRGLKSFLDMLQNWALSYTPKLVDDYFEHSHYSMKGTVGIREMEAVGITETLVKQVGGWMSAIFEAMKSTEDNNKVKIVPKNNTLIICEKFCITYNIMMGSQGTEHYNFTLIKSPMMIDDPHSKRNKQHRIMAITLNLWCLNPALIFNPLGKKCHSIIVTSGTLSPPDTFQSELGTDFKVKLEGKHVVPKRNFIAMNLTTGLSGHSLNAGYRNAETYNFQDDIGEIVQRVCSIVPHGVLVFLPSYRMLDKVTERWKTSGRWEAITQSKMVFMEPKGSNKNKFNSLMSEFDCHVEEGALLLAVCRGKISEGVDFANNSARAVITVGLPFPNFKDLQVTAKRAYNDTYSSSVGLLKGQQWYTIQGFRALNQALGRCLRHYNDWGAIIIVEERVYTNNSYKQSISKWIRDELLHVDCNEAFDRLENFCNEKLGLEDNTGVSETSALNHSTLHSTPLVTRVIKDKENPSTPPKNILLIDLTCSPVSGDLAVSPIKQHEVKSVPLFSNTNMIKQHEVKSVPPFSITTCNMKSEKSLPCQRSSVERRRSECYVDRTLVNSSPELFDNEGEEEGKGQGMTNGAKGEDSEDLEMFEKSKDSSHNEGKVCINAQNNAEVTKKELRETITEEIKRHHSPEKTGLVTKRRRVSRLQDVCSVDHREVMKEGSDRSWLRAQDLVEGSYIILPSSDVSLSNNNTNTVVHNIALGCRKCRGRIGAMWFEISQDTTVARVTLSDEI